MVSLYSYIAQANLMTRLHKLLNRFNLHIKLKILITILALTFLIGAGALYIFAKKTELSTNQFYDTNIAMVTSLNEIKDIYAINVIDTIAMLRKNKMSNKDAIEILDNAIILINKEWNNHMQHDNSSIYYLDKKNNLTKTKDELTHINKSIELLIYALKNNKDSSKIENPLFNDIRVQTINITDYINDLLKIERDYAFKLKRESEIKFETIKYFIFPMILLLFVIISAFFITISKNIVILNETLEEKSDDLRKLYFKLEETLHLFDTGEYILFKWNNDENWSVDYVSPNVYELLGYAQDEFLHNDIIYSNLINSQHLDRVTQEVITNSKEEDKTDSFIHQPYQVRKKDGSQIWIYDSTKILRDKNGIITHYIGYIHDITTYIEQSQKLETEKERFFHLANHDVLTNLPNRMMFDDRVAQAIKSAKRQKNKFALLFIDLDHFKEINDSLGHEVGDIVLQEVAKRLSDLVRDEDSLARLGGDEFTMLLKHIKSIENISDISSKIITALQKPIVTGKHELYVTSSIGISLYPEDGLSTVELLKNADAAMYKAKENGRNKFEFYTNDMTKFALKKIELEVAMRRALENNEFKLFYQPQININSGKITGAEALIRWDSPQKGIVSPAEFIPIFENSSLIIEITNFVLKEASKQIVKLKNSSLNIPKISINLSGRDIRDKNLYERISNTLKENYCEPSWIELEITEGFLMQDTQETIEKLKVFRKMGMDISIDDFGTGYSSLSYLKKLPITKLKIDQSFVRDMQDNMSDRNIIKAIIALSKSMDLQVIAEGVETSEQKALLQEENCDEMQGYLYSKPLSQADFEKLLISKREG